MKFSVLGPLQVTADDRTISITSVKQRAILAILALRANRVVPVSQLIDAVWGEEAPTSARQLVQTYVWRLRQLLGANEPCRQEPRIVSHPDGYLLRVATGELDAQVFEQLMSEGEQAWEAGDAALAGSLLAKALARWSADPVAGTCPEGAAAAEVLRLCELRGRALELRIEADLQIGRHSHIVAELHGLIAADQLREQLHAQLMVALSRSGRRAEALQAYAVARRLLLAELGVEPGPRLRQLHQAVLRGDPELQPPVMAAKRHAVASQPAAYQAEATRLVRPRQLPVAARHFTGRTAELRTLTGLLDLESTSLKGGTAVIAVISGTAGIGKTTLAVYWAHQVAHRFADGQLYVNLRGFDPSGREVTPAEAIRGLLDALEVPAMRIPASLDAQAALYRSLLAGRQMLVLLDNARDADQVRMLLPGSPGSAAIVTSRSQLTGLVAVEGASPITLSLFTRAEAHELVIRQLGPQRAASEPQAIDELIALCARLPLALSIAAARAATNSRLQLADLVAQLHHTGRLDTLDAGDAATNVRAVFTWSYRNLTPTAGRLLRLLGLHFGPDISAPAAASLAGLPTDRAGAALTELTRAHLLAEHSVGRYSFHDLLRAYAADQAHHTDPAAERRAAVLRVLDHLLHAGHNAFVSWDRPLLDPPALGLPAPGVIPEYPGGHREALAWFQAEHPVLLSAISYAASNGFDTHTWQLALVLSRFLDWQGHWHDLIATQRAALAAAQRLADPAAQARIYLYLGRAQTRLGSYGDSHINYRSALRLYSQLGDQEGQAITHLNLGWMWTQQNCHKEGLSHAQQALVLYQALGHQNGQANAHNDIGCLQALLGDYQQALTSCQLALSLSQSSGDRFSEACTWDSLGYTEHHLGHHHQAVSYYNNALDLFRNLGDRFNETVILDHLADTHLVLGETRMAAEAWQQALTILNDLKHADSDEIHSKLSRLDEAGQSLVISPGESAR